MSFAIRTSRTTQRSLSQGGLSFDRKYTPIAATTVLLGTPGYAYYALKQQPAQTFDIAVKVRGADGKPLMTSRTIPLLPKSTIDAQINEHATRREAHRPDGIIWKHSTATFAANSPIEDANANDILERDQNDPSAPGDLLFFAVMDGHSGPNTSRVLSQALIASVAMKLARLVDYPGSPKPNDVLTNAKSYLWPATKPTDSNPEDVALAIQNAFAELDNNLVNAPIHLLKANVSETDLKKNIIPDLSAHPHALLTMNPAISGSCAIMAVLDTAHRDLYVACTGDSRAVAGVWEEGLDGKGSWRVEVLSEDQTGRNENEIKRIQSEHPRDEAETVVHHGRVLGNLEPSRAFGDARYKWPRRVQEQLNRAFLAGNKDEEQLRPPPSAFRTPPYVTARPVVTHRKLSFLPLRDPSVTEKPSSTLRFIVLATDGLWDELNSDDVVALVGGHLAGLKGSVPKSELHTLIPTSEGSRAVEGKGTKRREEKKGSWAFVDDNVSAHLIRNAFGGGDELRLRKRLSIPPPFARRYRDDVTVTVVWWEDGRESEAKISSLAPAKAKL